jgi:hypothetical protein
LGTPVQPLAAEYDTPSVITFRWAPGETIEKPRPELTIDGGDADQASEPLRVVWSSD